MRKILFFIPILTILSCSGGGIEGSVGDTLKVRAEDNDDNQDFDYEWILENQPDGSLINSSDLIISDIGQEMSYVPDYPGDYHFIVKLSQYGDEVSSQDFHFTILDAPSKNNAECSIYNNTL